jgi:hypothetical protein
MPGIANKYFRIGRHAPSVCGMTSAPYALGVSRRLDVAPVQGEDGDGDAFTGLVVGDRVRDVSGLGTMNELLARWAIPQEAAR